MQAILIDLGVYIRPYLDEVAMAIIATLLVIYGDVFNKHIRQGLKNLHFLLRAFLFIWICAFGYGAIIVFLTPALTSLLLNIPIKWLLLTLLASFTILGLLAERRRYL